MSHWEGKMRERIEVARKLAQSEEPYVTDRARIVAMDFHLAGMLADLDDCQRAWIERDGEKTWYRLVPDPNPEPEVQIEPGQLP